MLSNSSNNYQNDQKIVERNNRYRQVISNSHAVQLMKQGARSIITGASLNGYRQTFIMPDGIRYTGLVLRG